MSDDIDPDRKFSNPTDWDNYIDDGDASDGSDGGFDVKGNRITARAMEELIELRIEITRLRAENEKMREENDAWQMDGASCANEVKYLRAELAAVTAERDRMREAAQLLINTQEEWERSVEKIIGKQPNVFLRAIDSARAALGGVTEPPR